MAKVLVIADTHIPFVHPNYFRFIQEVADEYAPDRIVHIGDLVDHHALSRFASDPDGLSSGHEWRSSLDELRLWSKAFPKVTWILGNHDKRPFNKAYDSKIPSAFLRPLADIYQLPKTWEVVPSIEIDGVLYTHGMASGGVANWQRACLNQGISTVLGHLHSVGGVRYHRTPQGQTFTLAVGSGIDDDTYAFAYGQDFPKRSMLGCGLVTDGVIAEYVPMDMYQRRNYRKRRQVL